MSRRTVRYLRLRLQSYARALAPGGKVAAAAGTSLRLFKQRRGRGPRLAAEFTRSSQAIRHGLDAAHSAEFAASVHHTGRRGRRHAEGHFHANCSAICDRPGPRPR